MKQISRLELISKEEEIIQKIIHNDKEAFDILYKRYWKPLFRYAGTFIKDEPTCEEIVQELFVQLYTRGLPNQISSSFSSYLFVALRNRILNYLRNSATYKKHISLANRKKMYSTNSVEQSINLMELQREINFSLNHMSEKCKEVYLLHEQNHYTLKEIAVQLSRPVDTVEKQLRKAMHLLRDHLRIKKMHLK